MGHDISKKHQTVRVGRSDCQLESPQGVWWYGGADERRSNEAKGMLVLMVLGSDPRQKRHLSPMGSCIAGSVCASYVYSSFQLQKMRNFRVNPPEIAVFSSDLVASASPS